MSMSVACVRGGNPSPTPAQGFIFNFLRAGSFSNPLGPILCACAVPLALAFVRRGHNAPGTPLESPVGPAELLTLPVS